ncbi:L-asparaginase 1 [Datura stramonium]|uniref:Aspartate aminotransferase n=1 Tax=Datura stramonium TaxID=4076 RepID=A0ABS8TSY1_DATST|nr:L-asparaginase 1 [Datura stramonium]
MAIRAAIISGRNLTLRASSSSSLGARSLSSSWWRNVQPAPKDSILGVTEAFLADRSPDKVNVGVGISSRGSHHCIWRDAHVPQRSYHYYNPDTKGIDFAAMMNDIKNAPKGSFFLLHACAHNPTGVDPTEEQWTEISHQFKIKGHFAFFDVAYQGLASGNPEKDVKAIRIFLEDGHPIGCAQSYAKNMGLYGQRVGCLSVVCEDERQAVAVKSQLQQRGRLMYSNPPIHGALVVSAILRDPNLKNLWLAEVKGMANRISGMRTALRENLEKLGSPLSWEHITNQIGMFCYSGMTPEQVDRLTKEYHIYMTRNGRISMAGVTTGNVGYLANAIHEVTKSA